MMKIRGLCVALGFLLMAGNHSVFAQNNKAAQFSGSYLLQLCAVDEDGNELLPRGHVACQAYIAGVVDYHNFIKSLGEQPPNVDFCIPENEGIGMLQKVVFRYLQLHYAQHSGFTAIPAVSLALHERYPCR